MFSPKQDIYTTSILPRAETLCRKEGTKIWTARGGRRIQGKSVFWTYQGTAHKKCTVIVSMHQTCLSSRQEKKNPNMEGRWKHNPFTDWHLTADGRGKSKFSLMVWPLADWPHSQEWWKLPVIKALGRQRQEGASSVWLQEVLPQTHTFRPLSTALR